MDAVIDHLVVTAASLDEGCDWVEARLGVRPGPGGQHALMGTHNRLLGLGPDTYLEVIAIDPGAAPPGRARWFGLDARRGPPRLTHWVMRVPDLAAALAAAPEGAGQATPLSRGPYRWRFAVTADGHLPFDSLYPALIDWQGPRHPARDLPDTGIRLVRLRLSHPDAARLAGCLPGADPRLSVTEGPARLCARFATAEGEREL